MLPSMFRREFGTEVDRYATLVDRNQNEFEVLVERDNHGIYLTKGWLALRDFYKVSLGAWVTLVFRGNGRFDIRLRDRFGRKMRCPSFDPPMKFVIEKNVAPINHMNVVSLPFVHDEYNFVNSYEKRLTSEEIVSGYLVCVV